MKSPIKITRDANLQTDITSYQPDKHNRHTTHRIYKYCLCQQYLDQSPMSLHPSGHAAYLQYPTAYHLCVRMFCHILWSHESSPVDIITK